MFGTGELLVIFLVVLILFGGKKLPELARSIGIGIREFKKACHGIDEEVPLENCASKKTQNKDVELESVTIEVEPKSKDLH